MCSYMVIKQPSDLILTDMLLHDIELKILKINGTQDKWELYV